MTTKLRTKVRLVKCPKCSKILPEPEQVPLYTCGGCGTILQAKYYKADNRALGLGSQDRVGSESNGILRSRDGGESSSSSQRSSSTVGQLSDQNEMKDHNAAEDHTSVQLGGANSDHFTSSSKKSILLENQGDGETDIKPGMSNLENQAVNQNDQDPSGANFPDEASFRVDTTVLENKEQYADATVENHNEACIGHSNSSNEASEIEDSQLLERNELSGLGQEHVVDVNKRQQISEVIDSDDNKQVGNVGSVQEASASNGSLVTGEKEAVRSDNHVSVENRKEYPEGKHSHEKISAEDNYHDTKESPNLTKEEGNENAPDDLINYVQEQLGSIVLTEPSSATEITQSRNDISTAGRAANSRDSRDTANMDSCNISGDPQCESNSLKNITETFRHETEEFDDVSACESEIMRSVDNPKVSEPVHDHREDGRLHDVVQRSPTKCSLAYDGSVSSFDGNDDQGIVQQEHTSRVASPELKNSASRVEDYSDSGFQNKAKTSSQIASDEKLKSSKLEEVELIEESAVPLRNRTRPKRDGFLPRAPLYRSSELVYESGSSSSYINEELPTRRMHHYPYNNYDNADTWVKRGYAQREYVNRRRYQETVWRENEFTPMYYNYETSGEIYHRPRHIPGYVDRRRRAESWSLSGSLPRGHYSGEIFNTRHLPMRDSYMNCVPDDVRWSGQLPPPAARWDSSYESCPTSPRKFMEPEPYGPYPWAHDAASVSGDQRLREQIMRRLQIREKRQAVKSHCRPLAGGAPFVTCYFCSRVVQLPEKGFLVARTSGVVHRVRCGACSRVLEFSLENETGLIPRVPEEPLEGEDVETNAERSEERVEEYQRAGGRSHSRQMKVTWQMPSRRSKSPLHRLMGYSSPHHMLNGNEADDLDS